MKKILLGLFVFVLSSSIAFAEQITFNGTVRNYEITNPVRGANGIVFVLHHLGGTAKQMQILGFDDLARQDNFIVVYPEAIAGQWNALDQAFIKHLMDQITSDYNISNRAYIVGASSGGVLAHGIATQYSQNVEAIATVGSSIPLGLRYPVRGVSVFMINGTQDPIVSYSGGNGLISARDSSTFWANANLCDRYISLEEADPSYDGTRVIKETYNHGRDESEVTLVTIEGGGHTWPGGPQFPSEFGTTCTHFDATGEIWKFFKKH